MSQKAIVTNEDGQEPYKSPPFTNPQASPSTTSELFARTRQDSPRTMRLKVQKAILSNTLTNDTLRGIFSRRICGGQIDPREMNEFLEGFGGILKFGKNYEIELLRSFIRCSGFRVMGNAHLLKFLNENPVVEAEKIKAEIMKCFGGNV